MTLEAVILGIAGILVNLLLGILIYEIRKLREETSQRVTFKEFRIQMTEYICRLTRVEDRVNDNDRDISHIRGVLSIHKKNNKENRS